MALFVKRLANDLGLVGLVVEGVLGSSSDLIVLRKSIWSSMTTYGISAALGLMLVMDKDMSACSFGAAIGVKCAV